MNQASLSGVTVLDLGQIYNGPYATFLMAMAGARVIKVESLIGEALRGRGQTSSAAYPFAMLNQNKESITVNLKSDKGKELFRQLVQKADVVVENFGPDTMINLGLSGESLLELNPRLIYASGSGYGRAGLHRDYLAMDITVQAMSGVMSTTGLADMPPMKAGPAICDFFGGVHLYGAVVTKLFERERTGSGAIIDVAMQDTVLPTLATIIGAYYYYDRQVQARTDNRHPALTMAPYNVYPAADGHVAIICVRDSHWRSLTKAMAREDLLERDDLQKMTDRAKKMAEVDALVSEWTMAHPKLDLLAAMQREGVPGSIVRDVEEVLTDRHLHDRGMLRDVDDPGLGKVVMQDSPLNVAMGLAVEATPAPRLGEHNETIYNELLGLSAETIAALSDEQVI